MFKRIIINVILVLLIACTPSQSSSLTDLNNIKDPKLKSLLERVNKEKSPEAYLALARYYTKLKQIEKAIGSFQNALKIDSARNDIRFEMGETAYVNNNKKFGLRTFKSLLEGKESVKYANDIAGYILQFKVNKITNSLYNSAFPQFSNDGKKIYYQTDKNGNWDIAELSIEGGQENIIIDGTDNQTSPTESSDGQYFAYSTDKFDNRNIADVQKWREIMIRDNSTDKITRLTLNYCDDYYPRFAKNRQSLIFVSERFDTRNLPYGKRYTNIFEMDVDGSFQVPLTKGDYFDNSGVTVLNGKVTLFSSDRSSDHFNIWLEDNSSKRVQQLTYFDFNCVSVDATNDGEKIAFAADKDGNLNIYLTNKTGNRLERITSMDFDADKPAFSPDGNYVAFHSDASGKLDIYIVNLNERSEEPTVGNLLYKIDQELSRL
jgi:Tol biopolymer transport system component